MTSDLRPIRRALISVYDKTGLDELIRALGEAGAEIVSTGKTAARVESMGLPVTRVEELTGFPEVLDGRVKTLHPKVHAGLLADLRLDSHAAALQELGIAPFDLLGPTCTRSARRSPRARTSTPASSRSTSAVRRWYGRPRRTTRASRS